TNVVPSIANIVQINSTISTPAPTPTYPASPTNLRAVAASSSQINLSWTDNSNNETGFKIERSSDGKTFTQISTVNVNVTTYPDSGLAASTKYYYRILAYSDGGNSAYSNTAQATTTTPTPSPTPTPTPTPTPPPSAPTNLAAIAGSPTQLNLSCADNSSNEIGFNVERSADGTTFTQVATVGANVASYSDSGLTSGSTYFYRVSAYNSAGSSAYSNTVSVALAAPAAPTNLT